MSGSSDDRNPDRNDNDGLLEALFRHASPRPRLSVEEEAEIRQSVHATWTSVVKRRRRRQQATWLAMAASAVLVVGITWTLLTPDDPGATGDYVAEILRVSGAAAAEDSTAVTGTLLGAGEAIETGNGRLALRLGIGGTLRLDAASAIEFAGSDTVRLLRGAVYFDSESERSSASSLTLETPRGAVSDIGTQYIARLSNETLEVSVRDGEVAIGDAGESVRAAVGQRIVVSEGGRIERATVELFGGDWAWVEQIAPAFELDGKTLFEFLDWMESQTGRSVSYENYEAESLANRAILSGVSDLEPMQTLQSVMATTDFDYRIDGNAIRISRR